MIQRRLRIGRLGRIVEVILCLVAVPVILGVLYFFARLIRWGLDRNYHMF
jgi:hypothetical protein